MERFVKVMKAGSRVVVGVFALFLTGCVGLNIPAYVKDAHPYKQSFYVPYPEVVARVGQALEMVGWRITDSMDPGVYEWGRAQMDPAAAQLLLFAVKEGVGQNTRLNIYVRQTSEQETEVEIRYLKITSLLVKTVTRYKNDSLARRIFDAMEQIFEAAPLTAH